MSLESHQSESPTQLRFALLTFSDTRDEASDSGGDYLVSSVEQAGHVVALRRLCSDSPAEIEASLLAAVEFPEVDLVLTTGGTGVAPRDTAYDTLRALFESEIPGFGELFRWLSYAEIGSATILSRAIGGLYKGKVVLALPGSPKALRLAMEKIILEQAGHLVSETRHK